MESKSLLHMLDHTVMDEMRQKNASSIDATTAPRPRVSRTVTVSLGLVLVGYVILSVRFISLLPLWGAVHDEQIHFGYCKYIALRGQFPRVGAGIYMDPRRYYTEPSAGEAAHHPPGYYLLGALTYQFFRNSPMAVQNYALRVQSLLLGLLALIFLWGFCREALPDKPSFAVAAVAGVAVFPHWLMMSSVIYVETFGGMATTGALWMLTRYARQPARLGSLCLAGAFLGLMALTKMTLLAFCIAAAWVGLAFIWRTHHNLRTKVVRSACFLGIAAAVGGWWYVRNVMVYGKLFPTSVLPGQIDTAIRIGGKPADLLTLLFVPVGRLYYSLALKGPFLYFWGPGDWLPSLVRPIFFCVAAVTWVIPPAGFLWGLRHRNEEVSWVWRSLVIPFLFGFVLFFYYYLRWTLTTCIQAHAEFGKFLMPLLGFFSFLFVVALSALTGTRRALLVTVGFVLFFLVWDFVAARHIMTVLIPAHTPKVPVP